MNATRTEHKWAAFLKLYGNQNKGRRTRLGVFENTGDAVDDYWIEDGLPLIGIDIDVKGELPAIDVILGGYSHSVSNVRSLKVRYSLEGDEDGIDIIEKDGTITVLRFENGLFER